MKKKLTIKEELAKRNYTSPSGLVFNINHILTYFMGKKYNCEYRVEDDITKEKGPAIVIFNHLSRFDHIFINQILYPRRYNIVAAQNEFYRGMQHFMFKIDKVIPKMNFTLDRVSMKAIKKVLGEGGTICFAPEGMTPMEGKNHPVVPGTGNFLKHYKVPVYQIELRGQFMIASKVCLDERLGGKCSATLRKLYSPEDLDKMTGEEIDADLNKRMRHDEYAWQKEKHYKYDLKGESCKNLEDLLFMCPGCRKMFTMKGEKDHISCSACGNGAVLNDYYDFEPFEGSVIPGTITEWADMERMQIIKDIRSDPEYSFKINVKLGKLPDYKPVPDKDTSVLCGTGEMTIDHTGVHFRGTKDGEDFSFDKPYSSLYTIMSALDFKYFDFYVGSDYYDFFPAEGEEGKVGYIQMLVEEMHRLHVNFLKNFPWNDYMYR